jgi:Na+/H+ antiporter NhaD/arsenite permease-like protein
VFLLIIIAFITHQVHGISLASLALGGGFLMMLVTKQDPEEILKEVEWPTLFFFIGLFVIIGGLEKTGVINVIADKMIIATGGDPGAATQLVLWVSGLSTTVINSIPYTATMISVIKSMSETITGDVEPLWWALSLGACFGGNGSLIGSAANIIVAGFSQKTDYPMKFMEYVKVGFPLMLVSIALTSVYLYVKYFL